MEDPPAARGSNGSLKADLLSASDQQRPSDSGANAISSYGGEAPGGDGEEEGAAPQSLVARCSAAVLEDAAWAALEVCGCVWEGVTRARGAWYVCGAARARYPRVCGALVVVTLVDGDRSPIAPRSLTGRSRALVRHTSSHGSRNVIVRRRRKKKGPASRPPPPRTCVTRVSLSVYIMTLHDVRRRRKEPPPRPPRTPRDPGSLTSRPSL